MSGASMTRSGASANIHYAAVDPDGLVLWCGRVTPGAWAWMQEQAPLIEQSRHVELTAAQHHVLESATGRYRLVETDGTASLVVVPPAPSVPTEAEVRADRAGRLAASDWMMHADVPATPDLREARMAYRQALRDVTAQPGFPAEVTWPALPA